MQFFRRWFSRAPQPELPPLNQPYEIVFHDGRSARAVRIDPTLEPARILRLLDASPPRPVLFVSGGATDMSSQDISDTRALVESAVAGFAQKHQLGVIDGGTSSGVMAMIGAVRRARRYTFPLIGVAPVGLIDYPGYANPKREGSLDSGHSHFALVNAAEWGSESQAYMGLCRALSGEGAQAAMGIIVNGGKITQKEAYLATCVYQMPILVMAGSGRFADDLAGAFERGSSDDPVIQQILASGRVEITSIHDSADAVQKRLAAYFEQTG